MRCYCTVCRKTAGGGGYAINIMAKANTFRIVGEEHLAFHQAQTEGETNPGKLVTSPAKRYFCRHCGSALWVADPRWADCFYLFASAIHTPLPKPPQTVHIMLDFTAPWVTVPEGAGHLHFERYPTESIAAWHQRHGLDDSS